jgi:hypothetical protein
MKEKFPTRSRREKNKRFTVFKIKDEKLLLIYDLLMVFFSCFLFQLEILDWNFTSKFHQVSEKANEF